MSARSAWIWARLASAAIVALGSIGGHTPRRWLALFLSAMVGGVAARDLYRDRISGRDRRDGGAGAAPD